MLRLSYPNGVVLEATDEVSQRLLLDEWQKQQVYTVGELAVRLKISQRSAYDLIRSGEIGYCCAGTKNYRVGEPAVRRFLSGLKPLK